MAFARGNSSWARQFNASLNLHRTGGVTGPTLSTWRMLSSAPVMSRMNTFALAAEVPTGSGFAEQFRDMSAHTISGPCDSAEAELETESEIVASVDANGIETNQITNLQSGCSKTWSYCVVEEP